MPDTQPLVVSEKERAVVAVVAGKFHRSANGHTKLVLAIFRARQVEGVFAIQFVVAQELIEVPVHVIGAGFDCGVNNRSVSAAEFRAVRIGLHLEFLDGVHRGLDHIVGFVQQVGEVGIVVNAVQQEIVLQGAAAVGAEAVSAFVARPGLAGSGSRSQQSQLSKVAPVQRQVHHLAIVHNLAQFRSFRLKQRSCSVDLDFYHHFAHLKSDIHDGTLLNV